MPLLMGRTLPTQAAGARPAGCVIGTSPPVALAPSRAWPTSFAAEQTGRAVPKGQERPERSRTSGQQIKDAWCRPPGRAAVAKLWPHFTRREGMRLMLPMSFYSTLRDFPLGRVFLCARPAIHAREKRRADSEKAVYGTRCETFRKSFRAL